MTAENKKNKKAGPVSCRGAKGKAVLKSWKGNRLCVATDIDGTLTLEGENLDPRLRGTLCPRAMESIHALTAAGMPVILVSGRPLPTIEGLALYLGLISRERTEEGCAMIAENGAVYKFGETVKPLARAPQKSVRAAVETALNEKPFKGECVLTHDNRLRFCDVGVHVPPALLADFRLWFEERPELGLKAITSNIMSHVVSAEVSKAKALKEVLHLMDLKKKQVVVFGDSDTDIPLFKKFPRSVAVANYFTGGRSGKQKKIPAVRAALPGGAGFAQAAAHLI